MLTKRKTKLSIQFFWTLLIFLICLIGFAAVIYSTVWGAVLSDDSYYYISSARNLIAGKGFDLTAHFPPGLSVLLSTIGLFNVDPLISVRWVNAILFALNIYLVARIIYTLTRSRFFSLLGAFLVMISSTLIMVHSYAMSEALFISFTLTGIMIYSLGNDKDSWRMPMLTGIFFGLAAATRYIGVALLLAGGIFWLTEKGHNLGGRIRNSSVFSLVGIIPLALWAVRNELLFGRPMNRVFAIHLIPANSWVKMLNTILLWFIPGRLVNGKELFWMAGLVTVLGLGLLYTFLRKRRSIARSAKPVNQTKPITLISLIILAYLFILIISRSFFDYRIPMDERLLSPILMSGLVVILWVFASRWKMNKWLEMGTIVVISLLILVTNLTRSVQMVQSYHEVGRGYASARDHSSETYAYLRNRPDIPVYSNAFVAIYFWTGRVTYQIPNTSGIPAMKADMHRTGALLVIFDSIRVELYDTTREELTQGLVEQIRLSEATIYRSP